MVIDTHVHLDAEEYNQDRSEVIARAFAAGVTRLITVGSGYGSESAVRATELASSDPRIFCSVGIHPLDASVPLTDDAMASLQQLATLPRTVAIGETGIDLHWKRDPLEVQEAWFVAQIRLARTVKKPLIIHSRLAGERCLELLQVNGAEEVGGVFHCYAEDALFAQRLKALNFLVSFTGVITFKKADAVRAIVREIPLDQIMVETDGPYMAPEPDRGKRCEPAFVLNTLATLAQIKGIPVAEAAAITTANATRLFRLPFSTGL